MRLSDTPWDIAAGGWKAVARGAESTRRRVVFENILGLTWVDVIKISGWNMTSRAEIWQHQGLKNWFVACCGLSRPRLTRNDCRRWGDVVRKGRRKMGWDGCTMPDRPSTVPLTPNTNTLFNSNWFSYSLLYWIPNIASTWRLGLYTSLNRST